MAVFGISFVHGAILGGLALASLPIIIHILNRRRFRTMEWAAMDFLLKAAVRNRRRVRLENLLLLALRVLLVALLVLAVARPYSEQSTLAGLFGGGTSVERVMLLDDSHSMAAGRGNVSSFRKAKDLLKGMVERLRDEKSGDRVTVMLGSNPRKGDARMTRARATGSSGERLLRTVNELRVSYGTFDLPSAVDTLLEDRKGGSGPIVLHILSDFRSRDWTTPDGELRSEIKEALGRFAKVGEIRLVDMGSQPALNIGIEDVRPLERAVVRGVPATFEAVIKNYGPSAATGISVTFRFGEQATQPIRLDGSLAAGEKTSVRQVYTLRDAGPVVVTAEINADILPGDDSHRRVVDARKAMKFLLVDGEPSPEAFRGETDYVAAALAAPGDGVESGVEVEVVAEHAFTGRELDKYDGIFLCNVYRLPSERVKKIRDFVEAGGGLMIFLGDQVDPQVFNESMYGVGENAGKVLSPVRVGEVQGTTDDYVNLSPPGLDHPVLRFMRGMPEILLRSVSVRYFFSTRMASSEAEETAKVRVLLRYTDEDESPALVEKSIGKGRVFLCTTAADAEWSDLPLSPIYLALLHEGARYIVRPDEEGATVRVYEPLTKPYDPALMPRQMRLVPPADAGRGSVELRPQGEADGSSATYKYDGTEAPGVYVLEGRMPTDELVRLPFAVNMDPAEGDLRRAQVRQVARSVPGARVTQVEASALLGGGPDDRQEFWRTLIYLVAAIALLETFLAWRFGHHHKGNLQMEGKQVFVR